jgi:hypothetical protein
MDERRARQTLPACYGRKVINICSRVGHRSPGSIKDAAKLDGVGSHAWIVRRPRPMADIPGTTFATLPPWKRRSTKPRIA